MKDKSKIFYERALKTCVLMLSLCIALKLLGTSYFNLNMDIPMLHEIDNIVMNSTYLSFLYSFTFRSINAYFIYIITTKDTRPCLGLFIVVLLSMLIRLYVHSDCIRIVIDFNILLIPCLGKAKIKEYYLVMGLNLIYQFLSLFIRNLGYQSCNYGLVASVLLNLDYYIMLVITYLYIMKGGHSLCGIVQVFYSSLAKRLWKKHLKNYLNKEIK